MSQNPEGDQLSAQYARQYAEIAELAGGLAHEIRNPLSTMRLNLELLSEDLKGDDSPRARRMLTKIITVQRESRHLEEILNAFLKFTRAGQLELQETDLAMLVREFVDFYLPEAREHGVEIIPHVPTNLPTIQGDPALLRQVLMNLAMNATQAMPNGGQLDIQIYVREGRIMLELIDTGIGMDEKTRAKIFQAFYSTKSAGSGLGLATVRKIVEAHQGTIVCDSEKGRGTRFVISLPVRSGTASGMSETTGNG